MNSDARKSRKFDSLRRTATKRMIDEQEFHRRSDEALHNLYRALGKASDDHEFEVDFGGTLTVEFEDPPTKFVVSPNSPVRQIWVSAHSKSFKLDWDPTRGEFILPESGQSLKALMQDAVSQRLGEPVQLS